MTEEQRKFIVKKITSYEEQISNEDRNITADTILFGIEAMIAAATIYNVISSPDLIDFYKNFFMALAGGTSACAFSNFKKIIQAICRKTILEGKIEDINTELEMPESEESIGKRR